MRPLGFAESEAGGGSQNYAPIKPAVYKAIVKNCDYKTGPSKKGFDIYFIIMEEGEFKNRTIRMRDWVNYVPTKGGFTCSKTCRLAKMLDVFGAILGKPVNTIDVDSDLIEAKHVRCYLKVESQFDEKSNQSYSNVVEIFDPKVYKPEASAPVPPQQTPPTVPQQPPVQTPPTVPQQPPVQTPPTVPQQPPVQAPAPVPPQNTTAVKDNW